MTGWQIMLFLLCVALATGAQGLTGFAFALILIGLGGVLELASLPDLVNVATVLSLASAIVGLWGTRRAHATGAAGLDMPAFRQTLSGSVVGVALGLVLLTWLSANVVLVLRLLLAITVVVCAAVVLTQTRPLAVRSAPASFRAFGLVSGVLGGMFSASGPPLVFQFYRQPLPLQTARDTLVAALAASSVLRLAMVVPAGQFSPHALRMCLMAAPVVVALSWLVRRYPPQWPRQTVLGLVCVLLMLTGMGLAAPAVVGLLALARG